MRSERSVVLSPGDRHDRPCDGLIAYLYDEFERRLHRAPVVFRLELLRPITEVEIGDPEMMHDPMAVTDGIEVSPDDQIIAARRGAYMVSLAQRTGGWQRRAELATTPPILTATTV